MKKLTKIDVPRFYGKNPQPQGSEPLLNDNGLLVNTKSRFANPNQLLLDVLADLHDRGFQFECVGTGLKVGTVDDGRKDSVCLIHNVNEHTFGLYVLKSHPDGLPKRDGMATEGEPIKGANSKSSRITIPYEGNTAKPICDFVSRLPNVFESGRRTTFNDGRSRKNKADKNIEVKPRSKKSKSDDDDSSSNVVDFNSKNDALDQAVQSLGEEQQSGRRKKNRKAAASA